MRQDEVNIAVLHDDVQMIKERGYENDGVRGRNTWDSQFHDTILTVDTLAIVDLFFAVSKMARRGCTFRTLSTFFLQIGEDLKSEHKTGFGWRQLTSTSYPATRSADAATSSPPQTRHCHRRTDTRREVKRTK